EQAADRRGRAPEERQRARAEREVPRGVAGMEIDVGQLAAEDAAQLEEERAFVLHLEAVVTKREEVPECGRGDEGGAEGGAAGARWVRRVRRVHHGFSRAAVAATEPWGG